MFIHYGACSAKGTHERSMACEKIFLKNALLNVGYQDIEAAGILGAGSFTIARRKKREQNRTSLI